MAYPKRDIPIRMASKYTIGDGCWEWTGAKQKGYGAISAGGNSDSRKGGRVLRAHRVLYEIMVGPIPEGMTLDHLCNNRACVRPDHLESVTMEENWRRAPLTPTAVNFRERTHCGKGHPFEGYNVIQRKDGKARRCRICLNAAQRRYQARKKATIG